MNRERPERPEPKRDRHELAERELELSEIDASSPELQMALVLKQWVDDRVDATMHDLAMAGASAERAREVGEALRPEFQAQANRLIPCLTLSVNVPLELWPKDAAKREWVARELAGDVMARADFWGHPGTARSAERFIRDMAARLGASWDARKR